MAIGETETLSLSIVPANTTFGERTDFTWESEDEGIATVSETGVVTGVELGTTTITVTSHNGIEKTCEVTVTNPTNKVVIVPEAEGQSEVATGEEMTLTAIAYGKNGTTDDVAQDFTWTSSNASVATVAKSENGNTATVTGVKAGTVTITATTTDGSNIRGTYTVKVIVAVANFTVAASAQAIVGKSATLSLTVEPTNATYKARTDFTWESSDEDVATVSTNGVVTGVKAGTATITVTSHNGIEKTCEVTITEPAAKVEVEPASEGQTEVATGEEMTLTATAYGKDETTNNVAPGLHLEVLQRRHRHRQNGRRRLGHRHRRQSRHGHHHRHRQRWFRRQRHVHRQGHRRRRGLHHPRNGARGHRRNGDAQPERRAVRRHLQGAHGLHLGKQR